MLAPSPHARAFSEHLSLLSPSWWLGEGLEPCGAWLKGMALSELAKEWKGTWQMAGRAALALGGCHLPPSLWLQSGSTPLASGPTGFTGPRALRLGFILLIAFDF